MHEDGRRREGESETATLHHIIIITNQLMSVFFGQRVELDITQRERETIWTMGILQWQCTAQKIQGLIYPTKMVKCKDSQIRDTQS